MSYWKHCAIAYTVVLILLAGCQSTYDLSDTATLQEQANIKDTNGHPTNSTISPEGVDSVWNIGSQMQVNHKPSLAAFMNQDFGITNCAGRDYREVFYTSDGGESWTESETKPG